MDFLIRGVGKNALAAINLHSFMLRRTHRYEGQIESYVNFMIFDY